jgi:hypothetical protein
MPLSNDWTPEGAQFQIGDRVVLEYPQGWNMKPCYGTVFSFNEDGTYYIIEAERQNMKLIDPENCQHHGAIVRWVRRGEKFPTPKKYLTPKEKREMRSHK